MKNPAYEAHCRSSMNHIAMASGLGLTETIEHLESLDNYFNIVFPYGDFIVYAWWDAECESTQNASYALYQFTSDDHTQSIEDEARLVYIMREEYDDIGSAINEAIHRAKAIKIDQVIKGGV